MVKSGICCCLVVLVAHAGLFVNAFAPIRSRKWVSTAVSRVPVPSNTQLHFFDFFRRKDKKGASSGGDQVTEKQAPPEAKGPPDAPGVLKHEDDKQEDFPVVAATVEPPVKIKAPEPPALTPQERAQSLRAQAQRARLEAEKMDAQLTLSKITKLEKEMAAALNKGESVDSFVRDMETLERKMRGEAPIPIVVVPAATTTKTAVKPTVQTREPADDSATFDKASIDAKKDSFETFSDDFKVVLANIVGMNVSTASEINTTEYAIRCCRIEGNDFSWLKATIPPPSFAKEDIKMHKRSPGFMMKKWLEKPDDKDAFALKDLTNEYYKQKFLERREDKAYITMAAQESTSMMGLGLNESEQFRAVQGLFPDCVMKEGQLPTAAQADLLMTDILPKAGFAVSGKPARVFGGFLIPGKYAGKSGDTLIDEIDKLLAKSSALRDKVIVIYMKDFPSILSLDPDSATFGELSTVFELGTTIYVIGPDVSRPSRRTLKTIVSAFAVATTWYLSIYPFLINSALAKRVDEQMALADASMAYDLSWLTDLSVPLFATFMGIQLTHEAGHRIAAGVYGLNITVPTFIPSLATGITSTLTSLKSPPKNREQLFDFAVAGPLCGLTASIAALYAGLQMTVFADPSTAAMFPALPLEILRQSSLGGGIVDSVLGSGTLSVPDGASQMIASITIPLHPVAVAGFIGLLVNAFALLPIGTTDGGRMGQALFNRAGKGIIGQIALFALLGVGFLGNDDLFLFYFLFCSLFQQGSEIPLRNEVDEISFSRVLVATGLGVVALLSLIPMQ